MSVPSWFNAGAMNAAAMSTTTTITKPPGKWVDAHNYIDATGKLWIVSPPSSTKSYPTSLDENWRGTSIAYGADATATSAGSRPNFAASTQGGLATLIDNYVSMTPPPGGSTDLPVPPTSAPASSGTDTTKVLMWGGIALVALYFATKSSGKGFRLI